MKQAFSLIELMVVIVILGLLAMFILPNLTNKSDEAKQKLTCIQMKSIANTLKMYKLDKGTYPKTQEGLSLLKEKNYFEDNTVPTDSWKNNYLYTNNVGVFEIISLGSDALESTEDDIYYSNCLK